MNKKAKLQVNTVFALMLTIAFALSGGLLAYIKIKFSFLENIGITASYCTPDLILLACVVISYIGKARKAAVFGIVFGFLSDTLINSPCFASVVVCFAGGYIAGIMMERFSQNNMVSGIISLLPAAALRSAVTFFNMVAEGSMGFADIIFGSVICEYIVNILYFVPVYIAIKGSYAVFERIFKWK